MVVRLALAPWTARLTLAIVVLFPVGGAPVPATARACAARCGVRWRPPRPGGPGGACGQGTSSRARGSTWSACGAACRSWWSRSAWRRPCGSSSSARGLLWGADRRRATAGRRLAVRGGRTGGLAPAGRRGRALAALGLAGREHRDHVAPILAGPDTVVDPGFNADATSLPRACAQTKIRPQGPPHLVARWSLEDPLGARPGGEKPSLLLRSICS